MNFFERWMWLLHGRKKYRWGDDIGLSRGSIEKLGVADSTPSWPTLRVIRYAENVNPEWLVDGKGDPYFVMRDTDEECALAIENCLSDEPWDVAMITDRERMAVALTQPGSYDTEPKQGPVRSIPYTVLELFYGGGKATFEIVKRMAADRLQVKVVDIGTMDEIKRGRIGTYLLCLSPEAILNGAEPLLKMYPLLPQVAAQGTSEESAKYQVKIDSSKHETDFLKILRGLSPERQDALIEFIKKWDS